MRFQRHQFQTEDKSELRDGTPFYSKYAARDNIILGFVMFFVWLIILLIALSDGCTEKPEKKGVQPIEEENQDQDVVGERTRVDKVLENQDGEKDLLLVKDLVKQYVSKVKEGEQTDQNASKRSDRPLNYSQIEK